MRPINWLIVHHTDSDRDTTTLEDVRRWHVQENGWHDVGYHYLIQGDGTLRVGRPVAEIGAHALGMNAESLGIALTGKNGQHPSAAQLHTLQQLLATLAKRHGLPVDRIIAHRDVSKRVPRVQVNGVWQSTATDCPGDELYGLLPATRTIVGSYLPQKAG